MAINKVFVIGAGTMGNGIAQVSAQAGYSVVMSDVKDEFVKKGMAAIEKSLDRGVKKGTMQESEKAAIMSRIKTTLDMKDAKDADMVIEAAPEILEIKAKTLLGDFSCPTVDFFREINPVTLFAGWSGFMTSCISFPETVLIFCSTCPCLSTKIPIL